MRGLYERGTGITLCVVATLMVAACNQAEERSYEADVEDVSGGELIVSEENPDAVPVDLPQTEMTNVPVEGEADEGVAQE